ncbi:MAG: LLM class flavin-dependent oxidoreductase [Nitrospinota bacterium]
MAKFTGFDIGLSSFLPLDVLIPCAQAAERNGFQRVWLAESYHARGVFSTLSAVAHHTQSIGLGSGIVSPFSRHPGILAMEAAALDELSGGRFTLGLGTAYAQLSKHQVKDPKPIAALREAIEMVRLVIRGEEQGGSERVFMLGRAGERRTYSGKVFTFGGSGVSIEFDPVRRDLPIFVGSMGPRTLQMAAEVADGILLNFFLTPAFLKDAMNYIRKGAEKGGKDPNALDIRSYLIVSVDKDRAAAKKAARSLVAYYCAKEGSEQRRYDFAGIGEEERLEVRDRVRRHFAEGEAEKGEACIPDAWVDNLTVSGTPEEVSEKLDRFAEEGLTSPACYHVLGPDPLKAIDLLAQEVMPHFL